MICIINSTNGIYIFTIVLNNYQFAFIISGELEHTLSISQPTILFRSSMNKNIEKLNKSTSTIQHIISLDHDEGTPTTTLLYEDLIKPTPPKFQVVHRDPDSIAAILYSSGTTGLPKGVAMTNQNWVFMLKLQG